ncbi:MAG TPA: hypothetical protein VMP08_14990 [Anaerolineae bacterium]|nr:hypothetical protein [Anaerolineae bacterium]
MAEEYEAGRYFGPPRFPGTTSIGYRQRNPEIFQDTTESTYETYPDWVRRSLSSILRKMEIKGLLPASDDLPNAPTEEIVQKIDKMLTFEALGGVPLCEAIPQQLYEDIFIRMVALLLEEESTSATINFYREFNAICHRIALALIDRLESEGIIGTEINRIAKLIQIAVLSGYVGINLKSSASAASTLLNRDFAPLKEGWVQSITAVNEVPAAEINQVVDNLLMVSEKPEGQFGLESLLKYQAEVIKTEIPTLLVFFCDDYLESVVDIKRLEVILDGNPHLVVLFIPRSGRYGNDIAYDDMEDILQESQFDSLHKHVKSERFYISPHGPKSGCIDPRYMSKALIGEISTLSKGKRVIFETKGCRNFEMLRGDLQIPWYAGFNCNRALSVRTVGIYGPPVFVRIPPGLRAYDQFVQPAIGHCPSYQTALVRFARMTTRQLYTALGSAFYQTMLERSENELRLNTILTELGDNLNLPFPETIAFLGARQLTD